MNNRGPDVRGEVLGTVGPVGDTSTEDCGRWVYPQQVVDVTSALARLLPALNPYERAVVPIREDIHTKDVSGWMPPLAQSTLKAAQPSKRQ
jgi:hypothetical protein